MRLLAFLYRYAIATVLALYVFTFGLLFRRNRDLIFRILNHFGFFETEPPYTIVPTVPLSSLVDTRTSVELAETDWRQGNATLTELMVLARFAKTFNPSTIFEIGTFDGRSTLNIALNAPGARVYTLDLPKDTGGGASLTVSKGDQRLIETNVTGARFLGTPSAQMITQLYGDSAAFDYTPYANRIDMIFIDGAHTYEYAKNDTKAALAMLSDRGVILWHDYDDSPKKGVLKYVNELKAQNPSWRISHIEGTEIACLIRG